MSTREVRSLKSAYFKNITSSFALQALFSNYITASLKDATVKFLTNALHEHKATLNSYVYKEEYYSMLFYS